MATFTVNTTADVVDGNYSQLSLREAVNRANSTIAGDTIVFASALEGQTLVLTDGELVLSQDITIDGDQDNDGLAITLDGNRLGGGEAGSRHLSISGFGIDASISDVTLINGRATDYGNGGSIYFSGASLKIENSQFFGNIADDGAPYI